MDDVPRIDGVPILSGTDGGLDMAREKLARSKLALGILWVLEAHGGNGSMRALYARDLEEELARWGDVVAPAKLDAMLELMAHPNGAAACLEWPGDPAPLVEAGPLSTTRGRMWLSTTLGRKAALALSAQIAVGLKARAGGA